MRNSLAIITSLVSIIAAAGVAAAPKPMFGTKPIPSYRLRYGGVQPNKAIVTVTTGPGRAPIALVPELPASRGKNALSAIERAMLIQRRFTELTDQKDGWWEQGGSILERAEVNGEEVVTWAGHGSNEYLLTCDDALASSWNTTPRKAARALIAQVKNALNPDWGAANLKGVFKQRIDVYRTQARYQKAQADLYRSDGKIEEAVQAYKNAVILAPDYVEAIEGLASLHDEANKGNPAYRDTAELVELLTQDLASLKRAEPYRISAEEKQEKKEWKAALQDYDSAIDASPHCISFFLLKYDACLDAQEASTDPVDVAEYELKARTALNMAKDLAPNSKWTGYFLKEVLREEQKK